MDAIDWAPFIAHALARQIEDLAGDVSLSYKSSLTFSGEIIASLRGELRNFPAFAGSDARMVRFRLRGNVAGGRNGSYFRFVVEEPSHELELVWTIALDMLALCTTEHADVFAEEILSYAKQGRPIPIPTSVSLLL